MVGGWRLFCVTRKGKRPREPSLLMPGGRGCDRRRVGGKSSAYRNDGEKAGEEAGGERQGKDGCQRESGWNQARKWAGRRWHMSKVEI